MAALPEIGENQEWFYLDSTGQEFGPFPSETMRDWFTQGFFSHRRGIACQVANLEASLAFADDLQRDQ